ncbi:hypothetical protein B1992_09935 [Pseudoxanthomonas broegbernensis]|uniref:DUF4166 domain-containing protein n=1 Tax=Pseudoxanthomonas broegbernensis TaxID=83619 RepID=A0A7V8K711_9GAMM|nr:DUF4166 domain-containing protein [Pseudoxanthomonas broegbernensis]KAF1686014.1 hypothetical protein B1992_09935 [Pseudoxanthomonas broegbernensis]MBB6063730.1 hypothetical protein [Pseudoxanthomonas broegbernensis]
MYPTVFQQVLRAPFFTLPDAVRALHSIRGRGTYAGRVDIQRGTNALARLCAAVAGLPPAMRDAPLRVEFTAGADAETWRRDFGGHPMASRLRCRDGLLVERLGPLQFRFALHTAGGAVYWNAVGARLFGIVPLPARLFAQVRCRERVHEGRYQFLVEATLPLLGLLIRYEGWLQPA